ncbi:MAG: hypothetical protein DMG25_12625 [Acidobacteria bacterium]|nr:MAG: hypothetical protein DMG25_12625 [Acidobacteriota bacterium]
MRGRTWVFDPQSGGQNIPRAVQEQTRERILAHAAKTRPEKASQVRIRFHGPFCYIDAQEPDSPYLMHLCRLRYFRPDNWSLAFYTYSNERYEPCVFGSGDWMGTAEEAFEIGALYLG